MSASDPDREAVGALVDAMATTIALPIDPRVRANVVEYLTALLAAAALVEEFPLPDDLEVAPVFRP